MLGYSSDILTPAPKSCLQKMNKMIEEKGTLQHTTLLQPTTYNLQIIIKSIACLLPVAKHQQGRTQLHAPVKMSNNLRPLTTSLSAVGDLSRHTVRYFFFNKQSWRTASTSPVRIVRTGNCLVKSTIPIGGDGIGVNQYAEVCLKM